MADKEDRKRGGGLRIASAEGRPIARSREAAISGQGLALRTLDRVAPRARDRPVRDFLVEALTVEGRSHTHALVEANRILKTAEDKGITVALIHEDPDEFEAERIVAGEEEQDG